MKKKIYSCMDEYDPNSISIEDALKKIKKISKKISKYEYVELLKSYNRVSFENIKSIIPVPNYNNSAMDGYAINFKDLHKNKVFKISGTSLAGKMFKGTIRKNECVKIMTGAMVPNNCNLVIMKEDVEILSRNKILLKKENFKINQNIRFAGEDIKANKIIIKKNDLINSTSMGILASQGISKIKVYKKPKISFFTSGDEVVPVGKKLPTGKVHDSNRFTLYGMLLKNNIYINDLGHVNDNMNNIKNKFNEAQNNSDIIISTGGVSVGDADFIKESVIKLGSINFWKVAIKPGRPLAFGKIKNSIFFGLPGNPVSVMITFLFFVLPCINVLLGNQKEIIFDEAILETDLKKKGGRVELQRGISRSFKNRIYVKSTGEQGSGILSSMHYADCLIYLPLNESNLKINDKVKIIYFKNYI